MFANTKEFKNELITAPTSKLIEIYQIFSNKKDISEDLRIQFKMICKEYKKRTGKGFILKSINSRK